MNGEEPLVIRRMEEKDLEMVCAMEKKTFSLPWSRESFLASLKNEDYLCLAALSGEEIAGYGVLLRSIDEGEIVLIAVREDLRRTGIGEKLLHALMKKGSEMGAQRFTLEVRVSNEGAIRMYEKAGFKSVGTRKGFYERPREDALIMWT